ncbi:MAG: hypothetical protein LBF80_07005 [Spirochaetaceae bacterium]|jgi:hypothetical protein|nr:hypothetical protein [Spirochaetaceae bacterium]
MRNDVEVNGMGMKAIAGVVIAMLLSGCENVLWNDLAVQGSWQKDSVVSFVKKTMEMEIDNKGIRWREKDASEWEEDLPCAASFGVLLIKFPGRTVRGSYFWTFNNLILSGFTWDDGLNWLNGSWKK